MSFQKGQSGNPAGRKKGTPNTATKKAREAFAALADGNVERVQGWLNQVAEKDPATAMRLFLDLAEFSVPKLQRTELTGKDGAELMPKILLLQKG